MTFRCRPAFFFSLSFALALPLAAQVPTARPADRITRVINDRETVARPGNRHPMARPEFDRGVAPAATRMDRMVLLLQPDQSQQQALEALLEAQQDPSSPEYHRWLTPDAFGERFGASVRDVERVVAWLETHGFDVEPVDAARREIVFSGTAAQVQAALHTEIHLYNFNGETHYANATDPEIPSALAAVVRGVVSLHNFLAKPMHTATPAAHVPSPEYTSGGTHYVTPGDFATIYDAAALYSQSLDGTGQSIAIAGRSDFNLSDVQTFRNMFGLPAKAPTVIVNGTDPGIVSSGEQMEATLDATWSGAVAKNATIDFVVSKSTNSSDGVTLSAQYIVNHNVAPIVSLSFGNCEAAIGTSGNQFWNSLWQQAAAQGMTVLVSAGDSGAAGCDSPSSSQGTVAGVNGMCSTPYTTCVGGTQFSDTANPTAYWSASNSSTYSSALSYIPEAAWNESATAAGGSGLWSGGGGPSKVYPKPSWQAGSGVPSDGFRDVPDVSLASAGHDGYLLAFNGQYYIVSGTSASAPTFAGLLAIAVQKNGRLGNANPVLYSLASTQASGGASVFHDITTGNNTVPGVTGFNAGSGYDLATGLGSVDASLLVNHWSDGSIPTPAFQASAPASVSLAQSASTSVTLNVTVSGGFNSSVSFSNGTLPAGLTLTLTPSSIAAPGSGSVTVKLTAASTLAAATYNVTIIASGGGLTQNIPLSVTITPPAGQPVFSLSATSASFTAAGGSGSVNVTATPATATWTAASKVTWITITKGASGTGSQTVSYSVAANTTNSARSGTLTIAGITFTVNQAAATATCTYQVTIGSITSTAQGYLGSVSVATAAGCSWSATSNATWLTISSGASGTGNGTVSYLAAPNTGATSRVGTLTVAGYNIQLTEQGTPGRH